MSLRSTDVVQTEEESTPVVARKQHKKREYTLENLLEGMEPEQTHHRLEEDSLVCPSCEETMNEARLFWKDLCNKILAIDSLVGKFWSWRFVPNILKEK